MLKYWRGGGGGGGGSGYADASGAIKAAVVREVEDEEEEENGDEGPFFDLEFAVPDEEEEEVEEETDGDEREEEEFDFAVSSGGSSGDGDGGRDVSLSPSDDLFFKGRLVPLEPAVFTGAGEPGNSKPAAQFPGVSFLKSATKFRVFLLGLKKPRPPPATTATKAPEQTTTNPAAGQQGKLFTVKFKVEEVPIVSLFTRDSSSKGSFKPGKAAGGGTPSLADVDGVSDAKRLLGKYLKMIKPLYVRVSRRYTEKLKLEQAAAQQPPPPPPPSSSSPPQPSAPPVPPVAATGTKSNGSVSLPAGLRVVCKHLGKSRSASSAAVLPAGTVTAGIVGGQMSSQRRDDSLLQQQDGIQSAILHCKRSLNASSP